MAPPKEIKLGRLTGSIVAGAHWLDQDNFPAHQQWADDVERVLAFLEAERKLGDFFPRLNRQNAEHRGAALAEARAAYFLRELGFDIVEWEPTAIHNRPVDVAIRLHGSPITIFVEVKAPTWQGEVTRALSTATPDEQAAILARVDREKYINAEARFIDPVGVALDVICRNALPKLADDRPNLVVTVDDLYMSPVGNPFLQSRLKTAFESDRTFERLGGVFLLNPESHDDQVLYRCAFAQNCSCLPQCALPDDVAAVLQRAADDSTRTYDEIVRRSEAEVEALKARMSAEDNS
jgi:hypothetical protein